jgi:CHASE2 domain-containing sensor protein
MTQPSTQNNSIYGKLSLAIGVLQIVQQFQISSFFPVSMWGWAPTLLTLIALVGLLLGVYALRRKRRDWLAVGGCIINGWFLFTYVLVYHFDVLDVGL